LLGHPVSLIDAMAIESLIQAAKSLFFVVPAGVLAMRPNVSVES
jgi:hypothetical protein